MGTVKEVGHFAWTDPYGWAEYMKGPQWKAAVQEQKAILESAITSEVEADAQQIEAELAGTTESDTSSQIDSIIFERDGTFHYRWHYKDSSNDYGCADFAVEDKKVWQVVDDSDGAEQYTLSLIDSGKKRWSHKTALAPYVAVLKDRCYSIESENSLWFCRLVSLDAETGGDRRLLVELTDRQWNMTLVKGENQSLFLMANNAGQQRLWHINVKAIELTGEYEAFVPVTVFNKEPHFFARKGHHYVAIGSQFKNLKMPSLIRNTPETCMLSDKLLITRRYGKRTLWDLTTGKALQTVLGNIELDAIEAWYGKGAKELTLIRAGYELCNFWKSKTLCPYAPFQKNGFAESRDGTRVPWISISQCEKPHTVLIIGYGGYGIATMMNTRRWKPLLKRGFAIAFAMVRGGGDHTDAWAEAARRDQKFKSVEDLEGVIRTIQRVLHIPASRTVLYGRSAGGYLMGAMPPRHPRGDLFSAVYVEVPYVDVFNTTANESLPLTQMEYNEFGDPLHRLKNAAAILRLSPIDALTEGGAPGVWILSRTGYNDKEVFAYESLKWIKKLQDLQRGNPEAASKLLVLTDGEGHFVTGDLAKKERALDMALLLSWLSSRKKSNTRIYKMLGYSRKNRKNNVVSRKNRKNRSTRNRKNEYMMGGENRKNETMMGGKNRKSTRKNRKTNRKNRKNTRRN